MDTLDRLRNIICEYVELNPQDITLETNVRSDIGLNSLELVNLAVAIEKEFGIEIADRDVVGLETMEDVVKLLENYMNDED